MSDPTDMPRDFGWRYLLWILWDNPITVLMTLQAIFLQLTLDPDLSPVWVHRVSQVACALGIVIAQIKKRVPSASPPPPTKASP
jgi:hypothetical protein